MNGDATTLNGGLLSGQFSNGFAKYSSDNDTAVPSVPVPRNKTQLNELLQTYYKLLKSSKASKEKYDQHIEASKAVDNALDFKKDTEGHFVDPTEKERHMIENVLYTISQEQQKFVKEEEEFFSDLLVNEVSETLDSDLFDKQVVGLQVLSKDLDLPESLQLEFNEAPKLTSKVSVDDTYNHLLNLKKANFQERAKALGLHIPETTDKLDPLAAPLGNYYAEKLVANKIINNLKEVENLPANIGTYGENTELDDLKIKSLIELKSLRLLSKQKQLKRNILVNESSQAKFTSKGLRNHPLSLQEKRAFNVRAKVELSNPHLLAMQLEELKKLEARKLKHQLHVNKIEQILESSTYIRNAKSARQIYRSNTLAKQMYNFHQNTEKEESKKLEKTAKQRLQALKANDEEAYIKLLDQTKDHRITHLLKQTNQFLDTLAQQVRAQQAEHDGPQDEKASGDTVKDSVDELREKIDYYQVAHRIQEEVTEQPSILVGGKLKEYQVKGLQWMVSLYNNKLNGILADEMGLGKTIQSISLITYLIENKHEDKFLVIVPLSTITNWTMEFEKWAPSVNVIVYKGSPQQRKSLQYDIRIGNFQVLLTTYEYIIRERPMLAKFNYSHMIIDEGHRMKNATSKLSITLKSYYKTKNRLILTGTPLQNNLPELWALLNFVLPRIFNSVKSFDEWFNTPFANTGTQEKIELTEEESLLVIRRLHKVLRPFLLRRLKKDVEKDLPDKVEKVLKCNLSGLQYILYQQMLKHNALFLGTDVGGAKSGIKGLNNKIMQLRKICNHPFVFEDVETVLQSTRMTNDLIWRVSGKFELLDRVLPKFKASGHRILMFFQMTQVMDIMEDFLRWRDMKYLRLDGSTKAEDRQDMLKDFNAPNSDIFCFLLSTRAGGLGLNLQTADTVIIFDTDWNPHQDLQAQDRAHRIGQKNEVRILRLITNDSVEEVILERAHRKLDIDGKVIQAGKFDNKSTAEEQEAFLKRLLEAEASKQDPEDGENVDEEELNDILARSEEEKVLFAQIDAERKKTQDIHYKTRLIEEAELPSVFTEDISKHFEKDTTELARMRDKKRVKYDDGLTEEQWLMAMDDDEDTVEDAIRRKEESMDKRKRRRANREGLDDHEGVAEEDDEEDGEEDYEDDDEQDSATKRPRRSRTPAIDSANDFTRKCKEVLDKLASLTDENDGHQLTEIFMKLPSRKLYPDYYQLIKQPILINQIKKLLEQEKFDTFDQFLNELILMCTNAKTYNEEGSFVYTDADIIEKTIESYR
jgi:ATP-dependent helicase STH1/SNF2